MTPKDEFYFSIRDKILVDVVERIRKGDGPVKSIRSGSLIAIRGAGRFLTIQDNTKTWRNILLIENFKKLPVTCLYLYTEKIVWKIKKSDKKNPITIDKFTKSWMIPEEIKALEQEQLKEAQKIEPGINCVV